MHCLYSPFWQETSFENLRSSTVLQVVYAQYKYLRLLPHDLTDFKTHTCTTYHKYNESFTKKSRERIVEDTALGDINADKKNWYKQTWQ